MQITYGSPAAYVRELQQFLIDNGFDPGPVDGIFGPMTEAAVRAFQESRGQDPTGVAERPDDPAGGAPGAPGGPSIDDVVRQRYGYMAWALSLPEVGDVLRQAAAENWDQARLEGAIQNTNWWKTTSDAARVWQQTLAQDPASAERQRQTMLTLAKDYAAQLGITFDVTSIVEDALKMGMSMSEVQALIRSQSGYFAKQKAGQVAGITGNLKTIAGQFAVPISEGTMAQWADQIANGFATIDGYEAYVREQAKSLFPGLAAAIDAGITVRQYAEPYMQIAAEELGINPYSVDLRDPKWMAALHVPGAGGMSSSMSLSAWTAMIRSNPQYGYDQSVKGQQRAAELADALSKAFGTAA